MKSLNLAIVLVVYFLSLFIHISLISALSPNIVLSSPADGYTTNDNTPSFTFTYTDDSDTNLTCELFLNSTGYGTVTANNDTATTITANSTVPDGIYNWFINCTDSGNLSNVSTNRTITIDTTPPQITIYSPQNTSYTTTSIYLNWTFSDNIHRTPNWSVYNLNGNNISVGVFGDYVTLLNGPTCVSCFVYDIHIHDNLIYLLDIDGDKNNNKIYIYNKDLWTLNSTMDASHGLSVWADDNYIYIGGEGNTKVYYKNNKTLFKILSEADYVYSLYQDNEYFYVGGNGRVEIYNKSTLAPVVNLTRTWFSFAIFTDNNYIYSVGNDAVLYVWYRNNFSEYKTITLGDGLSYGAGLYSNNTYLFAGVENDIFIYSLPDVISYKNLTEPTNEIVGIAGDNSFLYVATRDSKLYIYDMVNGFNLYKTIKSTKNLFDVEVADEFIYVGTDQSDGDALIYRRNSNDNITAVQGSNYITVYANDSAGNLNLKDIYFYVDTISPSIIQVEKSPICQEINQSTIIAFNQSDNLRIAKSYVNFTSPSGKTYKVNTNDLTNGRASASFVLNETGNWTYKIYISDYLTNNNATHSDIFTVYNAGECGGSAIIKTVYKLIGGGGGGGSEENKKKKIITTALFLPNKYVTIVLNRGYFEKFSVKTINNLSSEVIVSKPDSVIPAPRGTIIDYIDIDLPNIDKKEISSAYIYFTIPKNKIKDSPENIILASYNGLMWEEYPTRLIAQTDNFYSYEAEVKHFSVFYILSAPPTPSLQIQSFLLNPLQGTPITLFHIIMFMLAFLFISNKYESRRTLTSQDKLLIVLVISALIVVVLSTIDINLLISKLYNYVLGKVKLPI